MLRRHIPLLMLSLFAAFALVTPRAEAANITLLDGGDNIFCTDAGGAGTTCSKSIVLGSVDLTDGAVNLNFELQATVPQGTWNVMVTATDGDSSDTHSFAPIAADGIYYLAFSDFSGIDFSAINAVEIQFQNASAIGDSISVVYFAAVPEPGTAGMLMLGLFGLAAASPRKRIAA